MGGMSFGPALFTSSGSTSSLPESSRERAAIFFLLSLIGSMILSASPLRLFVASSSRPKIRDAERG
jgi:hypothetical protein